MRDIEISQSLGFNGARLHQKVFERRFLYECDKRGYLVWDEYPNWGFDYTTDSGLQYYLNEWMETVERDYNHPCVVAWVPLNETYWDVFGRKASEDFTRQLYLETKRFDASRPCVCERRLARLDRYFRYARLYPRLGEVQTLLCEI